VLRTTSTVRCSYISRSMLVCSSSIILDWDWQASKRLTLSIRTCMSACCAHYYILLVDESSESCRSSASVISDTRHPHMSRENDE
jgi:hypothetical protein